jgi:putative ABC transport system permease protein
MNAIETWIQDARYALRLLRRSPGFTLTAALSLAIGIGANTAIFSVANVLLLRPLPGLADAGTLVDIGRTENGRGFDTTSYPNYLDLRARATLFAGIYAYRPEPQPVSLGGRGEAERLYGTIVSGNYFTVLGARAVIGRLLQDEDDGKPGERAVAVISYDLWQRRFNADPAIAGQSVTINGHPFTIVGVAPAGFQGTSVLKPDMWMPNSMLAQAAPRLEPRLLTSRQSLWLVLGGRLKPGVTLEQAQAELMALGAALEREYPDANTGRGFAVARSSIVPGQVGVVAGFIGVLMVVVSLVLLIACVNVAGMLLARAAGRRREIAVRLAVGAGRFRLVRQLLTEAIVLFGIAGIAGFVLSRWITALLIGLLPQLPVPIALDIPTDWRVVSFAAAAAFAAAIGSGLAPALQTSRADLVPALKAEGLDGGPHGLKLRNVFVVGQVMMSLLLVIAAGLFLRALQEAAAIAPGFDERQVDVATLDLSLAGYNEGTAEPFVRQLLERTRALPGVLAASAAVDLPLDGSRMGLGSLRLPGASDPRARLDADWNVIEPEYFATLKMPLILGRDFTEADNASAPAVAIVNQALARAAWPNQNPVGQRLEMEGRSGPRVLTVVGVARDARLISLGSAAEPYIYVPLAQNHMSEIAIVARTSSPATIGMMRRLVSELNPSLPVTEALPLSEITAIGLVPQRIAAAITASLGVVGILLAAIGIYGVTAYSVSRRTREIGIRVALGADSGRVLRLMLRQGLTLAAVGAALGMVLAAFAARLIEGLLYGVRPADPLTFAAASATFALVTAAATYIPARRATRVGPMAALRTE